MWPWRLLLLVNIGCVFGVASALIARGNDSVIHNKVVAEIWEHGDIFFLFFETETLVSSLVNTRAFESCTKRVTTAAAWRTVWRENLECLCYQ